MASDRSMYPAPELPEVTRIRHSLRATQVELAGLVGVHPITVSKWERGGLEPSAYQLALLRDLELDGDPWDAPPYARDAIRRFNAGELSVGAVLLELLQLAKDCREGRRRVALQRSVRQARQRYRRRRP